MYTREGIIKILESDYSDGLVLTRKLFETITFKEHNEDVFYDNDRFISFCAWFKGCIDSLYYKPNMMFLNLVGEKGIGKTEFFRRLIPWEMAQYYVETIDEKYYYDKLIVQIDDFRMNSRMKKKIVNEESIWYEDNIKALKAPSINKRLCSYCGTANRSCVNPGDYFPKNIIQFEIKSIDFDMYNSIDKLKLWKELFYTFKKR